MVVAPVWTFVAGMQDADLHLVWLMLFAAEHGATIGGVPGAALLVVAVATVGQLLGVLGAVPVEPVSGLKGVAPCDILAKNSHLYRV